MSAVATADLASQPRPGQLAHSLFQGTSHVLGQERARKQLAILLERQALVARGSLDRQAGGAIVAGRTGTGKTMLVRAMCQQVGLPFAEANATKFTERGYAGVDLPQMFIPLLADAARILDERRGPRLVPRGLVGHEEIEQPADVLKRDDLADVVELAQRGVVLLDEFDKWMMRQNHVTGRMDKAIQTEVLKIVEGCREEVSADEDELGIPFDTTKVLMICAGAFVGLSRIIAKRLGVRLENQLHDETFWTQARPEDFIRYGLLPELAGRLAVHIFLQPLRIEHLVDILVQPGGVIEEYRRRFEEVGVVWAVSPEGVRQLAEVAMRQGTGARAVEHVCWQVFGEVLFDAVVMDNVRVVMNVNDVRARLVAA